MFRRKSICDGHDASYIFDRGAVSSKHFGHFLSCLCCMQYLAYRWTCINTDGVTGMDARTDRQTDGRTDGRTHGRTDERTNERTAGGRAGRQTDTTKALNLSKP